MKVVFKLWSNFDAGVIYKRHFRLFRYDLYPWDSGHFLPIHFLLIFTYLQQIAFAK